MSDPTVSPHLREYVQAIDPHFAWAESEWNEFKSLRLSSLKWHGVLWEHDIVITHPRGERTSDTWVVHVTGSEPNRFDVSWSQNLAELSGSPVATLFQIPNQPLWDLSEDDLIADTFVRFIESGDPTWPLLLPMVKSVVATVDALEAWTGNPLHFVPFGASKRGWTSWLTAASGDPRVVGVAPMLFDNLKMPDQLAKQRQDWGDYSPMIEPYISRGLDVAAGTARGGELLDMVDPASYLATLEVPVLMINGCNDPYWTSDALSLYWDDIVGPKHVVSVPNLGHAFEMTPWWTPSLAAFVRMCSGRDWRSKSEIQRTRWAAESCDLHFDRSLWTTLCGKPRASNRAEFEAVRYEWEDLDFVLTTPVAVTRWEAGRPSPP